MTTAEDEVLGALRRLRDDIDEQIATGVGGDPEELVERLVGSYQEALGVLLRLVADEDEDDEPEPDEDGVVVTVRTRADYVVQDLDAVRGAEPRLADAMYEHLHDQGTDRYLDVPGLRIASALTLVHAGGEVFEIGDDEPDIVAALAIADDEEQLRSIIDLW